MDKITVIIPCYWLDESFVEMTNKCLHSLGETTKSVINQVILVDDGSPTVVLDWLGRATLIRLPENKGYAAAVNAGLKRATGDYLIICNNDIEFIDPHWLEQLLRPLNEGYNISSIRTSDSDGYTTKDLYEENAKFGSIWAITRETYEALGPLDESFGKGYYEDQDYWRRARDKGLKIVKNHNGLVEHKGKGTFSVVDPKGQVNVGALLKYKLKWGDKVTVYETQPSVLVLVDDYDQSNPGFDYAKESRTVSEDEIRERFKAYL